MDELSKAHGPNNNYKHFEIYLFAMWMITVGFFTADPNRTQQERQALNDACGQLFNLLSYDLFKGDHNSSEYLTFCHEFVNKSLVMMDHRYHQYNEAFNRDKALAVSTPDNSADEFMPVNVFILFTQLVFDQAEIREVCQLSERFTLGFRNLLAILLQEVHSAFAVSK